MICTWHNPFSTHILNPIRESFNRLFYPEICIGCGFDVIPTNQNLCFDCLQKLPKTGYFNQPQNLVEQIFWGRAPVTKAAALFYFTKQSLLQHLIFNLKYKNKPEIGITLGRLLGLELKQSTLYQHIDYLVPLPLHPEKQFQRGYNQAETICNGIQETWPIPINNTTLVRIHKTTTQTKENRVNRWQNMSEAFAIQNNDLEGKHVLLIDDIITTGATLEASAIQLFKGMASSVNIATIAYTIIQ
ncbi:MAG: phosphoribosyltransferase family protein [Alphaproteobacteria bacterium]|nr:phosphoribosyltransferase family protein [Alphaproteobacteria bacterium]